jgi:hypothetical protein
VLALVLVLVLALVLLQVSEGPVQVSEGMALKNRAKN